MYIRVASLMAVVMGGVACSAVPTNGGHYQTYVASLCAFEQDLWTAASEAYNIQFTYDVKTTDTHIPLPPWTFNTKAIVTGEPLPGSLAVRTSETPGLLNLALLSEGLKPLVMNGPAVEEETTCSGNVCNTGPCVTVTSKNPAQIEWINIEPQDNVYTAMHNVAYDFTPYVLGWLENGEFSRCAGEDYTAIPTYIEATLKLGETLEDSAFVVELEAKLPLQKAGSQVCEDTLVTFTYQSGGLANARFLNLVLAKREESRLENQVRLAEGVEASLLQVQEHVRGISTNRPGLYRIRSRLSDDISVEGALAKITGVVEGIAPLAEQFGLNIDTSKLESILSVFGVSEVAPNQQPEALAQGVLSGQFSADDFRNLLPEEQQAVFDSIETTIQGISGGGNEAQNALAYIRGWIEDLRTGVNQGADGEVDVSGFDPQAVNPHNLPISFDGDSKDCNVKCQVDPDTMEPYAECLSDYRKRFVPGVAEGMVAGAHYRAAWYPEIGTVTQVCREINIAREGAEPINAWKWETYKIVNNNPDGYRCGEWAPSLGEVSRCPYSEANGLTCGVWSSEYCEPKQ